MPKLSITQFDVNEDGIPSRTIHGKSFEAMLNPSSLKHDHSIRYDSEKPPGNKNQEQKFVAIGDETLGFELILDGTGVVPAGKEAGTVQKQIADLMKVVYEYSGRIHQPHVVQIQWGSFIFYGRLQSLKFNYTLFQATGSPLRAKAELAFLGYQTTKESQLKANRNSPDLSHLVEVKGGDTLPLLCQRIYQDGAYYLAVARYNRIANFRDLEPGTRLVFPPLR